MDYSIILGFIEYILFLFMPVAVLFDKIPN